MFLSPSYDCVEFNRHYECSKETAFAYLCVVGAKALIICDANESSILEAYALSQVVHSSPSTPLESFYKEDVFISGDQSNVKTPSSSSSISKIENASIETESSPPPHKSPLLATSPSSPFVSGFLQSPTDGFKRGLLDEAVIKMTMIKEEQVRQFRRRFAWKEGLHIEKRARNGKVRMVNVKLVIGKEMDELMQQVKKSSDEDYLEWRGGSIFGITKRFSLKDLESVTLLTFDSNGQPKQLQHQIQSTDSKIVVTENDDSTFSSSSGNNSIHFGSYTNTTTSIPLIRFRNSTRHLDLRFTTHDETNACLLWIDSIMKI